MVLARRLSAVAVVILIVGGVVRGAGQGQPAQGRSGTGAQTVTPPVAPSSFEDRDASEIREQLYVVLDKYPPTLGRVLKMDPSLLNNPGYLSSYPALASFLASHPEVAHNPAYFLARVQGPDASYRPTDAASAAMEMWRSIFDSFSVFVIFSTVTLSLIWLIKTLLDWRRWTRLARVQAEVHSKLLDRFTASEELLAYIQTPAGRRFLESGPVLTESGPRPLGAPVSRILWSFQAGIVLAVGGIGLVLVSGRVQPDVAAGLSVIGVLAISLGVGFVLSGIAAWLISRRMGLFDAIIVPHAGRDVNAV